MDAASSRFLDDFAAIKKHLRKPVKGDRHVPFAGLVARAAAKDAAVRRLRDAPLELAELRNLVVHNYSRTAPLASPSEHAVGRIEAIKEELLSPPRRHPAFARTVATCRPCDPVGVAARKMHEGSFSQLPVYDDGRLVGLLTAETLARWLAARLAGGLGLLEEEPVAAVLKHQEGGRDWQLLGHAATVFDALEAFEACHRSGRVLDAILLTPHGSEAGIVTASSRWPTCRSCSDTSGRDRHPNRPGRRVSGGLSCRLVGFPGRRRPGRPPIEAEHLLWRPPSQCGPPRTKRRRLLGEDRHEERLFPEVEDRLRPLAAPLAEPEIGDWLAEHREKGQTFRQYLAADPVRRDRDLTTIHLCLLGDFTGPQQRILDLTQDYLGLFFDVPVRVRRRVPLGDIPARARRTHPDWGDEQVLSTYVLHEVLEPDRPDDALAYLALTTADLWPGEGWNFVFGQANLRRRVGVQSMYRNGDPGEGEEAGRLCLRRTLATATHETGHVLTMRHCIAFSCLMNGSNHREESDSRPLHPCPVCLRKLLWNLQVEPVPYLRRLEGFCRANGPEDEADWYNEAVEALG